MTITEFEESHINTLRNLGAIGANYATTALSKMLKTPIVVMTVEAGILPIDKIAEKIGFSPEMVSAVLMPLYGDLDGKIILVFPKDSAIALIKLLNEKDETDLSNLSEEAKSAINETGNIVAGTFLRALSNYIELTLIEGVPTLMNDTGSNIGKRVIENASTPLEFAVNFQINFEFGSVGIKGYSYILFDKMSAEKIFNLLKSKKNI